MAGLAAAAEIGMAMEQLGKTAVPLVEDLAVTGESVAGTAAETAAADAAAAEKAAAAAGAAGDAAEDVVKPGILSRIGTLIKKNPMNTLFGATMVEQSVQGPIQNAINQPPTPAFQPQAVSHVGGTFNRHATVSSAGYSMNGSGRGGAGGVMYANG